VDAHADAAEAHKVERTLSEALVARGGAEAIAEAAAIAAAALNGLHTVLGEAHAETLKARAVLGRTLAARGDLDSAERELRAAGTGLRAMSALEARRPEAELADVLRRRNFALGAGTNKGVGAGAGSSGGSGADLLVAVIESTPR
jgi:hypothetical protein